MANLTARSATEGLLPVSHGALTLSEVTPEAITSLMPLAGADFSLPQPNRTQQALDGVLLWSGRNQALLLGPAPGALPGVALTDQSDAWAVLHLEGQTATDALARLTPLDLDLNIFKPGHTARSLLGHMNALFHRAGPDGFDILIFRSMAASAVHEIEHAMKGVSARLSI